MRVAILTLVFAGVCLVSAAQQRLPALKCATEPTKLAWLEELQRVGASTLRSDEVLYIPVIAHVVMTDRGRKAIQEGQVLDAFCTLNEHFAQARIQFILQAFRYIQSSAFYAHSDAQVAGEMMLTHQVSGAINTYFVADAADACGYTLRNQGMPLGIAISSSCTGLNTSTWAHEMGHFLSLPHTFHGWENYTHDFNTPAPFKINQIEVEKKDRSNCRTAGDGFCDTQADYLNGRWFCEGIMSTILQKDPNGAPFTSDGSLLMSYSSDPCANRFSPEQRTAMRLYGMQKLPSLLQRGLDIPVMPQKEIQLLYPSTSSLLPQDKPVTLAWEGMPNADAYLVEVSPIPSFSFIPFAQITTDTTLTPELPAGRVFFWRVRPYNKFTTCRMFSKIGSFSTQVLTELPIPGFIQALTIFPNPIHQEFPFSVQLSSLVNGGITLQLTSVNGQPVFEQRWTVHPGENTIQVPVQGLPAGTYFLRLSAEQKTSTHKVIILPKS